MNKKANFRFGYRVVGKVLPNLGVVVFNVPKDLGDVMVTSANTIKTALIFGGKGEIADAFVCEFRDSNV